ncbi:hypothetical protein ACGFJ5_05035 [Micromonospora echinaurantiaca]|uniref:hypothetical protein n=1 Tax=Micromonospora echinaurantiaca TaxID=47857 RepID=UPI003711F558
MDQRQRRGQVGQLLPEDAIGLVRYLGGHPAQPAPGSPEDITNAVPFLPSGKSSWMTGAIADVMAGGN